MGQPLEWRLARDRRCLDPTVPAVRNQIAKDIAHMRRWGFELIKVDYTTVDLSGRWGHQMGAEFTNDGWSFADRSHTTAEVISDLYRCIREAAGDEVLIVGCNTVGHLAAGIFELQRVGDDTGGTDWGRTCAIGVNCLAFRAPQHDAFFAVDADCVGRAEALPWAKNRRWLDLVARSGTPLFVSIKRSSVGAPQQQAIRDAFAVAAKSPPVGSPLDWLETRVPKRWWLMGRTASFAW